MLFMLWPTVASQLTSDWNQTKSHLPKNIVAELDMGQDAAEVEASALCASVEKFLSGDFSEYDEQLKEYISDVPTHKTQPQITDTSADEVVGWAADVREWELLCCAAEI